MSNLYIFALLVFVNLRVAVKLEWLCAWQLLTT